MAAFYGTPPPDVVIGRRGGHDEGALPPHGRRSPDQLFAGASWFYPPIYAIWKKQALDQLNRYMILIEFPPSEGA